MKKDIKHLLIIRLSAMGDVAIAAPLIRGLCKNYPTLKITILTKDFFSPIFEEISPQVQVFKADLKGKHKGFLGIFKLYQELKKLEIDAVADLHGVLRTYVLRFFFSLSGIFFTQINKGRFEKKMLTLHKNKELHSIKSSYLRYCDVIEKIGFKLDTQKPYFLTTPALSPKAKSWVLLDKKLIGIAPFATHKSKEYSFEKIKIIIKELSKESSNQILLFAGRNEAQKLAPLEAPNVSVLAGKLSFKEELQIIAQLNVMLSMDSGNGHLAAMYGVPTITLWGVTHPCTGFSPYFQPNENQLIANRELFPFIPTSVFGNKYPQGYEHAINTISVVQILQNVRRIIYFKK